MMGEFIIFLSLILTVSASGKLSNATDGSSKTDVTYEELESLELTCNTLDSCQRNRTDDLSLYNCHCGANCTILDTCCVDSEFRTTVGNPKESNIKCLSVYGETLTNVYMVDNCGSTADSFARGMCGGDAERKNDPFLLIPVTSPVTGISYRNYFCAECNGDTELAPPVFWDLKLVGKSEFQSNSTPPLLAFNASLRSWTVRNESEDDVPIPVSLTFQVPDVLKPLVKYCRQDVVSKCPDTWQDPVTAKKCLAYMAIVVFQKNETRVRYRNPHCAICNAEDVEDFICSESTHQRAKPVPVHSTLFVGLFSFDDKTESCKGDKVYDSLAKKCRVLKCYKNQQVVNGVCTAVTK